LALPLEGQGKRASEFTNIVIEEFSGANRFGCVVAATLLGIGVADYWFGDAI